jgi:hypothetical protein
MSKLYAVDFRKARHRVISKRIIQRACDAIEDIDYVPAGFVIVVWDDTGRAAYGFDAGGPVSLGGMPTYVSEKLRSVMQSVAVAEAGK